jgi:hypothetical protein
MADYYQYRLKAGIPIQAPVQGKMILVDDVTGADGVDITPMLNNSTGRTMPNRKKAFKCWVDYDAIVLKSDTDCIVSIWLAKTDVSLGFADGALVNVVGGVSILNDMGSRVPVELGGSNVTITASNVHIGNDDTEAIPVRTQALSAIVHKAPVVVGTGAAVVVCNDATLRRLVVRNDHQAAVLAVGGAGVTMANAAIKLQPGESWITDDAANLAWYAISDTANTEARVMGMK